MLISKDDYPPLAPDEFITFDAITSTHNNIAVECPADHIPEAIIQAFDRIAIIRIAFVSSADGRGFSIAASLRELGYKGRLRAFGQVISDQFRYATECGFDEVEVDSDIAARQPQELWRYRKQVTYRDKLAGRL